MVGQRKWCHPTIVPGLRSMPGSSASCRPEVWLVEKSSGSTPWCLGRTSPEPTGPGLPGTRSTMCCSTHAARRRQASTRANMTSEERGRVQQPHHCRANRRCRTGAGADLRSAPPAKGSRSIGLRRRRSRLETASSSPRWLRKLKVANRELGTIHGITDDGRMALTMDGGRSVSIDLREASPSRPRLCRHQPLQPGPDRRSGTDQHRYGAGSEGSAQQSHGLCVCFTQSA